MSDDFQLTRRGLLKMVSAVLTVASFAARRPLFAADTVDMGAVLDAEVIEEEPSITDRLRGAKLERFLRSRGIRPAHLARESGYSRAHLLAVRLGRVEPTGRCAAEIVAACRRLAGEPLRPSDLFDLPSTGARAVMRIQQRLAYDQTKEMATDHAHPTFL